MTRYKLTIEYDGRAFFGWQRLGEGPSVQGALEHAVYKLTGAHADVIGAGRTDSGVHAKGQVAHLDLAKPLSANRLRDALNAHLRPHAVAVLEAKEAAPEFHARFDAIRRRYHYRIRNRRAPLTFETGFAWRLAKPLDAAAMHEAAQDLIGHHDFTTFRDSACQAPSPVKTLERCDVSRDGDEVLIVCEARSFLHRQVRSMVGSLAQVGIGRWRVDDVGAALKAADRARCGAVAPADGLYLMRVDYR